MKGNLGRAIMQTDETRISVCMAAHNGEKFIGEQLASILPQLTDDDEMIIVDDASQDDTLSVVDSFQDRRICVFRQNVSQGVVASFGYALGKAKGKIVFLTDQDDVWRSDKVERFLEVFNAFPDVTIVMSDLLMINATGRVCSEPQFGSKKFRPGIIHNLIRNRYQGSAMAFRSRMLNYCLPFPSDIPMHDAWIGLVSQCVGKAAFISEPLLLYRRHGSNSSPDKHAPISQMVHWRWSLIKNLARFYFR